MARLDVYGFLLSVMDGPHLAAFLDALWCRFGSIFGSFLLQVLELIEGLLERCGHGIALEEGYAADQIVFGLYASRQLSLRQPPVQIVPWSSGRFSRSTCTEKSYPLSGATMYGPYSRSSTACAPYCTNSEKHLTWIETRILVFASGVEIWKVTPSKSDTTWSIETGGPLLCVSYLDAVWQAAG